ncbi:MAG: hypothetical protein JNL70_20005 [Saprospiraceae bacterium]|nr:hypothetical protein [Saprospiraceae bacterium]
MKTIHPHHNFQWKQNLHYALLIGLLSLSVACQPNHKPDNEEQKAEGGYENYVAETRRAALGDDWERITQANFAQMEGIRLRGDVIAGGLLQGSWYERGGSNVAGRMDATFYYPATEEVYSISQSGTLFKGALTGGTWSVQNDAINFNSRVLGVISASGTKRIIAAKTDQYIYYSDDDGASWTQASGSIVSGSSGGGKKLIIFSNGTLFYLQYASGSYYLYRSADNGVSWTTVQTFTSRNDDRVEMFSPYGTNDLYVLDNGTALYSLTGTATSLTAINTSMSLTTNAIYYLSGYFDGTNVTLYVVVNRSGLYKSTDLGTTWTNVSTLPSPPFNNSLLANPFVANTVYYGTIEFKKSSDGGATFASQNAWADYYTNTDKIHADIGTVTPFTKSDGTKYF